MAVWGFKVQTRESAPDLCDSRDVTESRNDSSALLVVKSTYKTDSGLGEEDSYDFETQTRGIA